MKRVVLLSVMLLVAPIVAAQLPTIGEKTAGMEKLDGFLPLYWDATNGALLIEISRLGEEILYQVSLPAGLGSNPVGLDRGQLGGTHIVRFERVGPRILMVQPNYRYRALSGDRIEQMAVEDSFAQSVLWGFDLVAEQEGRVLVDATSFVLRDAHGVARSLQLAGSGNYTLDVSRSALHLQRTKAFPRNSEIEAILTFTSDRPEGRLVRDVAPTAEAVTVRQHLSFVELPREGYRPRAFDPRVGVYGVSFYDFSSPISEPIETRWIARHRLEKKDPSEAVSEPVEPIVYYLDPGTPEPVRSALLEGAAWWDEAFEAAGFRNAFEVRLLPEDADPMDVRYNLISWVHRSTRGWSYGGGVLDPRTGEILKGNVTLGSLRVRQDILLAKGLLPLFDDPEVVPSFDYLAALDPAVSPTAMALARIRQLSAHEVGHTIGLSHNFAASTYGRASVMDYPAPMVQIRDGRLDLSDAYASGIGEYDKLAVRYAYSEFPEGTDEPAALEQIIREGIEAGMLYLTDKDARPEGASHPLANLWDNGDDPIEMLRHQMKVREIGLANFGLRNIPRGQPVSLLETVLMPLYLHQRYQVEAAVKSVGGVLEAARSARFGTRNSLTRRPPYPGRDPRHSAAGSVGIRGPGDRRLSRQNRALVRPGRGRGGCRRFCRPRSSTAPSREPARGVSCGGSGESGLRSRGWAARGANLAEGARRVRRDPRARSREPRRDPPDGSRRRRRCLLRGASARDGGPQEDGCGRRAWRRRSRGCPQSRARKRDRAVPRASLRAEATAADASRSTRKPDRVSG
jgi:hypothetical protein